SQRTTQYPSLGFIQGQHFYTKYQDIWKVQVSSASSTFIKIPGLTFVFSHAKPLLYEVDYYGNFINEQGIAHTFVKVMVDGSIFTANRLLPNNDRRATADPALGSNLLAVDRYGASLVYSVAPSSSFTFVKSERLYLPAGVHLIEIGVRTDKPTCNVYDGVLDIKLTEFDTDANVLGLKYPVSIN
ncbi:unnamed protein product, partial [Didymodactylos carnosus]